MTQYRRSLLYADALTPSAVRTAAETEADIIILDLEARVPASEKEQARKSITDLMGNVDFGDKAVCVRINGLESGHWLDDILAALTANVDLIRVPKITESVELRHVVAVINHSSARPPDVIFQIESPMGLLNGAALAKVCQDLPLVTGISVGINDYTSALGTNNRESRMAVRQFVLTHSAAIAAAGDMDALGCGYFGDDLNGLRSHAELSKRLGHVGQIVVNTESVDVVNDVYKTCDKYT